MRQLLALSLLMTLPALADQTFVPTLGATAPVSFDIGFTAGVHRGTASSLTGSLVLDATNRLVKGTFTVPLSVIRTSNETRDCHLREAMGIDYSHSQFPAQHVCDGQNRTPVAGPDSVVFPNIDFEFTNLVQTSGGDLPATLAVGTTYNVFLRGKFSMHGQSKLLDGGAAATTLVGKLIVESASRLRLQSAFPVVLKDYGIIVKPSKLGPVTISVADKATVTLNIQLALRN